MARILLTAATGRVGSALLPMLLAKGHTVLAVTSRQNGVETLRASGAQAVLADIRNPDSMRDRIADIDAVFLATADDPKQDIIEQSFVAMIAQAGAPHIVKLSAQSAGLKPPVSFGVFHCRSEIAIEQSGLPYTILQPTFFLQSLLLFAEDVSGKKRIIAPVGRGQIAMVDVNDVARTTAAVIGNQAHFGKSYVLTGPSAHGFCDVVECLSKQLGHTIAYTSPPALVARIVMPFMTGMPRWKSNLVVDLLTALRAGAQSQVNQNIEQITGEPANALETFISQNLDAFKQ